MAIEKQLRRIDMTIHLDGLVWARNKKEAIYLANQALDRLINERNSDLDEFEVTFPHGDYEDEYLVIGSNFSYEEVREIMAKEDYKERCDEESYQPNFAFMER
jgi:hypothetical protein